MFIIGWGCVSVWLVLCLTCFIFDVFGVAIRVSE